MEILWAGWRSTYLMSADNGPGDCLFCGLPEVADQESLILERGEHAYSVINRYPYSMGHVMAAPYRHVAGTGDLDPAERLEIWELLVRLERAAADVMAPDAFNLGANLGRVAGAGVPGHLHLHLVPRWTGDANFMTTIGHTRVMPEKLEDTWAAFRRALELPVGE